MKIKAIVTAVELDKSSQHWGRTKVSVQDFYGAFLGTFEDDRHHPEFKIGQSVTITITPVTQEQN
jgi:hypothetical protein